MYLYDADNIPYQKDWTDEEYDDSLDEHVQYDEVDDSNPYEDWTDKDWDDFNNFINDF